MTRPSAGFWATAYLIVAMVEMVAGSNTHGEVGIRLMLWGIFMLLVAVGHLIVAEARGKS